MAVKIPREVALSICRKIREENRDCPSSPQAQQCRSCETCCNGAVIKSRSGDRACCQISQRYVRMVAISL